MIKYCMSDEDDISKLKLYKTLNPIDDKNKLNDQLILTRNIMTRLMNDKFYFFSENYFKINFIEFNNLKNYNPIDVKLECLFSKNANLGKIQADKIKYLDCDNNKKKFEKKMSYINSFKDYFKRSLSDKILDENNNSLYKGKDNFSYSEKGVKNKDNDEKHYRLVWDF